MSDDLKDKYKNKGAQSVSFSEYRAAKAKAEKKKKTGGMPPALKFILMTPFLIIFCFGLLYLPFIMFKIFTGTPASATSAAK